MMHRFDSPLKEERVKREDNCNPLFLEVLKVVFVNAVLIYS